MHHCLLQALSAAMCTQRTIPHHLVYSAHLTPGTVWPVYWRVWTDQTGAEGVWGQEVVRWIVSHCLQKRMRPTLIVPVQSLTLPLNGQALSRIESAPPQWLIAVCHCLCQSQEKVIGLSFEQPLLRKQCRGVWGHHSVSDYPECPGVLQGS